MVKLAEEWVNASTEMQGLTGAVKLLQSLDLPPVRTLAVWDTIAELAVPLEDIAEITLKRGKMLADSQLEREKMRMEIELRRMELSAEAEVLVAKAMIDPDISTNLPRVQ